MTGTKDVQVIGVYVIESGYPVMLVGGAQVKLLAQRFATVLREAGLWEFINQPEEYAVALALQTLRELGLDTE